MPKSKFVTDLEQGDRLNDFFMVVEKELRTFRNKPGNYLQVKVADKTGQLRVKIWEDADKVKNMFNKGDVVQIKGIIDTYEGNLEVSVVYTDMRVCHPSEYDLEDYYPKTEKDVDELASKMESAVAKFKNKHLKALMEKVFSDKEFMAEFKKCPAAKVHHHAYIGGLIEHTYGVVLICKTLSSIFPELDPELLMTGAMLHDIGKTSSYSLKAGIDITPEEGLKGHVLMGYEIVKEKIMQLPDFPDELKNRLLHLILAHHDKLEWGSVVRPRFSEAYALHIADYADSQVKEFIKVEKEEQEKERYDVWGAYSRRFERFLYLGPVDGND